MNNVAYRYTVSVAHYMRDTLGHVQITRDFILWGVYSTKERAERAAQMLRDGHENWLCSIASIAYDLEFTHEI